MSQLEPVNLSKVILWEHEQAEKLKALVAAEQKDFDERVNNFYVDWVRDVFNVDTANDFGLHIWARILKVNLGIPKAAGPVRKSFGFGALRGNFSTSFARTAGYYNLTLEQKRLIIKLRYAQLTTRPSSVSINEAMAFVFKGFGGVVVRDSMDMSFVNYFFAFEQTYFVKQILDNFDLLPRPSGVGVKYTFQSRPAWGFGEFNRNFNNGNFGSLNRE